MTDGLYDIGDTLELSADFTDLDGDPADPAVVELSVKAPDGTVEVIEQGDLTNDEVGTWSYLYSPDQTGLYWYRFVGEGNVDAAEEKVFRVRRRHVPAPSS